MVIYVFFSDVEYFDCVNQVNLPEIESWNENSEVCFKLNKEPIMIMTVIDNWRVEIKVIIVYILVRWYLSTTPNYSTIADLHTAF